MPIVVERRPDARLMALMAFAGRAQEERRRNALLEAEMQHEADIVARLASARERGEWLSPEVTA